MTKEEFMKKNNVSKEAMERWLKQGWIRGAYSRKDGTVFIPDSAIPPYSKRSTRCKGIAIYYSIIKGCSKGYDVFPELYNMHPDRFDHYVDNLVELNYIKKANIGGIMYLHPLPKCGEFENMTPNRAKRVIQVALETLPYLITVVKETAKNLKAS